MCMRKNLEYSLLDKRCVINYIRVLISEMYFCVEITAINIIENNHHHNNN